MQGWSFTDFLTKRDALIYLRENNIKNAIKELIGLILENVEMKNLIVTHENLFFEFISEDNYQLRVNYLSVVGQRFLQKG